MRPLTTHLLLSAVALLLVGVSCRRNTLCYDTELGLPINVVINWDLTLLDPAHLPENMHLLFFPAQGGNMILDFVDTRGGVIFLEEDDYAVLTVNGNTQHVYFRGTGDYSTYQAYVPRLSPRRLDSTRAGAVVIDQPDSLYVAFTNHFRVYPSADTLVLEKAPVSYVKQIPFTIRSIRGIQYLRGLEISIDNLAQGVLLNSAELLPETGEVLPRYTISADSITGSFTTFGHYYSSDIRHTFTVTFLYAGALQTRSYDVTQMMDTQDRILINDQIVFEPVPGEGFQPGVGDWEHEEVILPD